MSRHSWSLDVLVELNLVGLVVVNGVVGGELLNGVEVSELVKDPCAH